MALVRCRARSAPPAIQRSKLGTHKFDKVLPRAKPADFKEVALDYAKIAEPVLAYKPHETFKLREIIDEFYFSDRGRDLHSRVRALERTCHRRNSSLTECVTRSRLLSDRESLSIGGNPFFALKPHTNDLLNHPLKRAASILHSTARFTAAYTRRLIEPDAHFHDYILNRLNEGAKGPIAQALMSVLPARLAHSYLTRSKAAAIDQSQYVNLLATTRAPGTAVDAIFHAGVVQPTAAKSRKAVSAARAAAAAPLQTVTGDVSPPPHVSLGSASKHAVVFSNGHAYAVDILDDKCDPLPEAAILASLIAVKADAAARGRATRSVAVLTAAPRHVWAAARAAIIASAAPTATVDGVAVAAADAHSAADAAGGVAVVEGALCALSFEETTAVSLGEEAHDRSFGGGVKTFLHGAVGNRWYDKSVTWVVAKDGLAAVQHERGAVDDDVVGRFCETIMADVASRDEADTISHEVIPVPSADDAPELYHDDVDPTVPTVQDYMDERAAYRRRRRSAIGPNPYKVVRAKLDSLVVTVPTGTEAAKWSRVPLEVSDTIAISAGTARHAIAPAGSAAGAAEATAAPAAAAPRKAARKAKQVAKKVARAARKAASAAKAAPADATTAPATTPQDGVATIKPVKVPTVDYYTFTATGRRQVIRRKVDLPPRSSFPSDAAYVAKCKEIIRLLVGAARQGRKLRALNSANTASLTSRVIDADVTKAADVLKEDGTAPLAISAVPPRHKLAALRRARRAARRGGAAAGAAAEAAGASGAAAADGAVTTTGRADGADGLTVRPKARKGALPVNVAKLVREVTEWQRVRQGRLKAAARLFDMYGQRFSLAGAMWPADYFGPLLAQASFKNIHSAVPATAHTVPGTRTFHGRQTEISAQSHQSVLALRLLTETPPHSVLCSGLWESFTRSMNIWNMRRNMANEVAYNPLVTMEAMYQLAKADADAGHAPLPNVFVHETWRKVRDAQLRVTTVPSDDYYHSMPFLFGGVGPKAANMYSVGHWSDQKRMTWTVTSDGADVDFYAADMDKAAVAVAELVQGTCDNPRFRNYGRGGHFLPQGVTQYDYPFPEEDALGYWMYNNLPQRVYTSSASRSHFIHMLAQQDVALLREHGVLDFTWRGIAIEHQQLERAGYGPMIEAMWNSFMNNWLPLEKVVEAATAAGKTVSDDQMKALQSMAFEAFVADYKIKLCMQEVDRRVHPLYPELDNLDLAEMYDHLTKDPLDFIGGARHVHKLSRKLEGLFTEREIAGLDEMAAQSDLLWAAIFESVTRLSGGQSPGDVMGVWSVFGAGKPESAIDSEAHMLLGESLRRSIKDREKTTSIDVDAEAAAALTRARREAAVQMVAVAVDDRRMLAEAEIEAALGGKHLTNARRIELQEREGIEGAAAEGDAPIRKSKVFRDAE